MIFLRKRAHLLQRIVYFFFLFACSSIVLVLFLRHGGVNNDKRFTFTDMVNGTAYKPFVYRTFLPSTVRIISAITPAEAQRAVSFAVDRNQALERIFENLRWRTSAAYEYAVMSLLMLMSFIAFGHYAAKLTMKVCGMGQSMFAQTLMSAALLMGVPLFFKYNSNPYDPPQLFLFTLALYFLSGLQLWPFVITFAVATINKETAILLIPIFLVRFTGGQNFSRKYVWISLLLGGYYILVKLLLAYLFRANAGGFVELHLVGNVLLLESTSMESPISIWMILLMLSLYGWNDKPQFYRTSFLFIFPPLLLLALFFGNINEWRIYYEVYPIVFGMVLHSILRMKRELALKPQE